MGDQRGVGRRGADDRQVGRDLLVELDELIALGSGELADTEQLFEASPVTRVRDHVRIEVHTDSLGAP